MDAINGIVIADDSLVVDLLARKQYACVPQLAVTITPLPAMAANRLLEPVRR
jgi:Holliday junction resolvase RusA-like endonuclease